VNIRYDRKPHSGQTSHRLNYIRYAEGVNPADDPPSARGVDRRVFLFGWSSLFRPKSRQRLCGIDFRVMRYAHSPRRFLVIHGDETTARDVLSDYMFDHYGVAYMVTNSGRNVQIEGLTIDPNRMFSRVGAERSLTNLNPGADSAKREAALRFLDRQRGKLLKHLMPPHGSRLFALHNNRDYSVDDEIAASDRTSLKQRANPREFFLCTDPHDFEVLSRSPYNVVLQTKAEPDDGSLSRFAARAGFRYINLECAIGAYEDQMERVRWLEDRLP
jgi:hypothetical protein